MVSDNLFRPGLEGVIAEETRLSSIDGNQGILIIGGFLLEDIASSATFEEMLYLLWHDRLPAQQELKVFHDRLAKKRTLSPVTLTILEQSAVEQVPMMDALQMATATLPRDDNQDTAKILVASFPTMIATYWRLTQGLEPIEPDETLSHCANYLWMLTGTAPDNSVVRALETYLNTVVDHGFNASTFTARTIISTDSDMVSAITGAIGALKGPKHGGAPGPALDMVFEIGKPENAEPYLRAKFERRELLMGFGHRVYKVRDPRADVLNEAVQELYTTSGEDQTIYQLARHVEAVTLKLFEEYKPGRRIQTNVEYYTALLLHGVGLSPELFSPTFAIARVGGWTAHCFEHLHNGRIIRPLARYVGEKNRQWVPLSERSSKSVERIS